VVAPIIFLIVPRYVAPPVEDATKAAAADMKLAVADSGPSLVKQMGLGRAGSTQAAPESSSGPRSYTRATHTFNRRFLEGQLAGFVKPEADGPDAGLVLEVVHSKGSATCPRVSRLTMNDIVFLDHDGKEVPVEYSDLKEIHVKPA